MKFLIVAALLVATVSAKSVKINSLTNCGGPGAPITFSGSILTDPVAVPGQMLMDLTTTAGVAATAGDGLMVRKVTTRTADNYQVPCFNGISGTCTVNFCDALVTYPDAVCSIFPPGVACSCPVEAGTYHAPDAFVTFEADWLAINGGVAGDYTSRTQIISSLGAPNELILGCIDVSFTLFAA
ncbi:ganglioside GM2 activator-like [Daphnia pulicaria]|uniref:ganglioside GM2 activator-like n=1 Tax=Daphnia pulicaria TaxID=35523 RepID=UPI001EEA6930|nr:ganglioside GM2 activator-like [Daphnia pulicaria]